MKKIDCIYLMGGFGQRAKLGFPKQFQLLGGKPIFIHGLEVLNKIEEINKIIIVSCDILKTKNIISNYHIKKTIEYVENGDTRQKSVFNTLENISTKNILISESVRPFMTIDLYKKVINNESDNVTPMRKSISTLINKYGETFDRDEIGEVQMPQKYNSKIFKSAHIKANEYVEKYSNMTYKQIDENSCLSKMQKIYEKESIKAIKLFTDDLAILNYFLVNFELSMKVIPGEEANIKITSPLDLTIAEAIYEKFNYNRDE